MEELAIFADFHVAWRCAGGGGGRAAVVVSAGAGGVWDGRAGDGGYGSTDGGELAGGVLACQFATGAAGDCGGIIAGVCAGAGGTGRDDYGVWRGCRTANPANFGLYRLCGGGARGGVAGGDRPDLHQCFAVWHLQPDRAEATRVGGLADIKMSVTSRAMA